MSDPLSRRVPCPVNASIAGRMRAVSAVNGHGRRRTAAPPPCAIGRREGREQPGDGVPQQRLLPGRKGLLVDEQHQAPAGRDTVVGAERRGSAAGCARRGRGRRRHAPERPHGPRAAVDADVDVGAWRSATRRPVVQHRDEVHDRAWRAFARQARSWRGCRLRRGRRQHARASADQARPRRPSACAPALRIEHGRWSPAGAPPAGSEGPRAAGARATAATS